MSIYRKNRCNTNCPRWGTIGARALVGLAGLWADGTGGQGICTPLTILHGESPWGNLWKFLHKKSPPEALTVGGHNPGQCLNLNVFYMMVYGTIRPQLWEQNSFSDQLVKACCKLWSANSQAGGLLRSLVLTGWEHHKTYDYCYLPRWLTCFVSPTYILTFKL